ncbi:hypothetical protein CAPTEDRAFT_110405 [Capitella teleta]|uniref:peptide-methionine (R)-S-oxide reductase n=1 Tax=Capitella teleta TaxID=283909 RepID=R7TV75_CAPTE|nr:hypothetical protein CAPTEDRAFT_110405 [Capitella teleta]|eukprot:ELT95351.1 hypothetical protein CAPTEDRAFT_110405 [Capitella teleta]
MAYCEWTGEIFKDHFEEGCYKCKQCGQALFSSGTKYAHDSPWPAFTECIQPGSIVKVDEGPNLLKVRCSRCNAGLGHEFVGGGPTKNTSRF